MGNPDESTPNISISHAGCLLKAESREAAKDPLSPLMQGAIELIVKDKNF
jgi:hypothetical protein